jgi:hypothetical protein
MQSVQEIPGPSGYTRSVLQYTYNYSETEQGTSSFTSEVHGCTYFAVWAAGW